MKILRLILLLSLSVLCILIIAIPVFALTINKAVEGEGGQIDGTYIGGSTNYTCVNSDDALTTYLRYPSSSPGTYYHCWDFEDFSLPNTINSVTVTGKFQLQASSYSCTTLYCRIAGTNYYGTSETIQSASLTTISKTWTTNPATGTAWTSASLNAAEFGARYISIGYYLYCTYIYMTVDYLQINPPTGTTDAANLISSTTARLNGTITDDGGQKCDVQFAYDNTTRANWADYVNNTTLVSDTYNTGDHPYADISSLTKAKTYYFRIGITNDNTTVYGAERNFTTESGVYAPTNTTSIPYSTSISIAWTKGTGANMTEVRYKLGTYPTTTAEGTLATLTTGNSVSITELTAGRTYYISLWGYDSGIYSNSYTTTLATTVAYNPATDAANNIETPTASTTWTQTPSSAKLTTVPFHEIVEDISTSYGTPLNMIWYVIWVVIGLAGGILLYNRIGQNGQSSYNLPMVLVLEGIWFGIGAVIGLTMMWIVVFLSVTSAGFIAFGHRH